LKKISKKSPKNQSKKSPKKSAKNGKTNSFFSILNVKKVEVITI